MNLNLSVSCVVFGFFVIFVAQKSGWLFAGTLSHLWIFAFRSRTVDPRLPTQKMDDDDNDGDAKGGSFASPSPSSSADPIDIHSVQWRILPCLTQVIPGGLRKSVLATSADLMSSVQSDDTLISPFPKVSRASTRHSRPAPSCSGRRLSLSNLQGRSEADRNDEEEKGKRVKSHGLMLWKRRRGKFAVSSQSDITSYMWMPFLSILET
jgi:hypothetical protein